MKVLHIYRSMRQGGAEKVIFQLCRDNRAHKQYVISHGGALADELERYGVKQYHMPDVVTKNPFLMAICFMRIFRVCKRENIDILHTHHRMATLYGIAVSRMLGKKHIFTCHNIWKDKKALFHKILSATDAIVAVGEDVARNLTEDYGIPPERIRVIRNAINEQDAENGEPNVRLDEERKRGSVLIGAIGRLSTQKGVDIFLRAVAPLIREDSRIKAVIIGDGPERGALESLAGSLGVSGNVIFLGFQEHALNIIRQLDFAVLASRYEGLPLTPLEVFSQGKTMVASNIGGVSEIIQDGVNGLLFESGNVADLSAQMNRLLQSPETLAELENAALSTYRAKFSYQRFLDEYNALYEKVGSRIPDM